MTNKNIEIIFTIIFIINYNNNITIIHKSNLFLEPLLSLYIKVKDILSLVIFYSLILINI